MTSSPDGLHRSGEYYGEYYEGVVGNVSAVLELHKQDTVSTFGIRMNHPYLMVKTKKTRCIISTSKYPPHSGSCA
jgi:hypothetical protein